MPAIIVKVTLVDEDADYESENEFQQEIEEHQLKSGFLPILWDTFTNLDNIIDGLISDYLRDQK